MILLTPFYVLILIFVVGKNPCLLHPPFPSTKIPGNISTNTAQFSWVFFFFGGFLFRCGGKALCVNVCQSRDLKRFIYSSEQI